MKRPHVASEDGTVETGRKGMFTKVDILCTHLLNKKLDISQIPFIR